MSPLFSWTTSSKPLPPHRQSPHAYVEHEHEAKCPFINAKNKQDKYMWCPAQEGDYRSPCPALNTLANHGYLPRDGKDISVWDVFFALHDGYHLSYVLAFVLAFGGWFLIKQWGRISLFDLARHGDVEHDASLAHLNTKHGYEYAPIPVVPEMVDKLCDNVPRPPPLKADGPNPEIVMDAVDIATARVRRENEQSVPLDPLHAEIARGEMAIVLGIFRNQRGAGGKTGIPVEWLREWMRCERLPWDWKPDHWQGLFDTVDRSTMIRTAMTDIRSRAPKAPPAPIKVPQRVPTWPADDEQPVHSIHLREGTSESTVSSAASFKFSDAGETVSTAATSRLPSPEPEMSKFDPEATPTA